MLKIDFKNDLYTGNRKYRQTQNSDGTISLEDATEYTETGDAFGANEVNAIGKAVNKANSMTTVTLTAAGWEGTDADGYTQTVSVANVTAEDLPVILIDLSTATDFADQKKIQKNFGFINHYDTANGSITFTALKKPDRTLTIGLKGVD